MKKRPGLAHFLKRGIKQSKSSKIIKAVKANNKRCQFRLSNIDGATENRK